MNDCVWAYIINCEDGCKCCGYRSMNSDEGRKIMDEFDKDTDKAIKPLQEKWEKIFDSGEW